MATDYVKLSKEIQSKGYKRNLSSKEIGKFKSKALKKAKGNDDVFEKNKKKATSTPMHKWLSQFE